MNRKSLTEKEAKRYTRLLLLTLANQKVRTHIEEDGLVLDGTIAETEIELAYPQKLNTPEGTDWGVFVTGVNWSDLPLVTIEVKLPDKSSGPSITAGIYGDRNRSRVFKPLAMSKDTLATWQREIARIE